MISAERTRWAPLIYPVLQIRLCMYFILFSMALFILLFSKGYHRFRTGNDWDVIIFTQNWPNTVCLQWEEGPVKNHTCHLPKDHTLWTIHGIWPTKFGTLGPNFCNSSYQFNVTLLQPIISNLTELWTEIEVPKPAASFWKHEWLKHGTCCAGLPSMDTELKYFKTGLTWLGEYNMRDILSRGGVFPDSNRTTDLTTLWLAAKLQLGYNPSFHCLWDKKTHQFYLQEIRICFDKTLKLTDCDGVKSDRKLRWKPLGNCPDDKPIVYPSTIPSTLRRPVPPPPDTSILSLYKVIQFVRWLTS